jgi:hypothetical protein
VLQLLPATLAAGCCLVITHSGGGTMFFIFQKNHWDPKTKAD